MSLDQHQQLKQRTKAFALRIIRMMQALPRTREAGVIGRQVLRSATSVAPNFRGAGRDRSKAEFTAKLGVVMEEADETVLWFGAARGLRGIVGDPQTISLATR